MTDKPQEEPVFLPLKLRCALQSSQSRATSSFLKSMKSALKYSVPLMFGVLIANTHMGLAQERYMPPTYRETMSAPPAPLNPNWTPVDEAYDGNLGETPLEPAHPFFDIDWSVLLSGTHTGGTDAGKNFVTLTPEISFTHVALRGQYAFDIGGEFSVSDDQVTRLNDFSVGYAGTHELDAVTQIVSSASLQVAQDDVNAPGVALNIKETPQDLDIQGEIGIIRQFGKFVIDGRASTQRRYSSDTMLFGDLARSNAERSFTQVGTSLRLAYAFSPEIGLFVQGDAGRDWYDAAPASTGVKLDATEYGVSGGATLNWRNVIDLELSAGYVVRQHVDASIADRGEAVYGVSATYTPNDALTFTGTIDTTIRPEDVTLSRQASTEYNASGSISYAVAPWLALNMTQTAGWVFPETGVNTEYRYGTGFGVEAALNKNLSVTANYLYSWAEVLPSNEDPEFSHAATIGIKYAR